MPKHETPSSEEKYQVGQIVKCRVEEYGICEMLIEDYDAETEYYTLRGFIGDKIRGINIPGNMMDVN